MTQCLLVAASPLHSRGYIERVQVFAEKALPGVKSLGVSTREAPSGLEACDSLIVLVATGGSENVLLSVAEEAGDKPVAFIGLPYANGVPALLEAAPLVSRASRSLFYAIPCIDCSEGEERLVEASRVLGAAARLWKARLGVIGGPSPWLVYSRVDPALAGERLGVELVDIGLDELYHEYSLAQATTGEAGALAGKALKTHVPVEEIGKALRLYHALKKIVEKHRLDALTVKCFDIIPVLKTTACLAFSLLNSEGVVAGCEGDVPATLAMMIASWSTGEPVFMGNPAVLHDSRVMIAHCTAPIALGEAFELKTHFETGVGVGVALYFPVGRRATLLRLSPSLDRARIVVGRAVEGRPLSSNHCRSQLWVEVAGSAEEVFLDNSMGNHYVVVMGDYSRPLSKLLKLLGLGVEVYR